MRLDRFRQIGKVCEVMIGRALALRCIRPLLDREAANRLEHAEAGFFRRISSANQTLIEKVRQSVLDLRSANGTASIEGPTTIQTRQPPPRPLLPNRHT